MGKKLAFGALFEEDQAVKAAVTITTAEGAQEQKPQHVMLEAVPAAGPLDSGTLTSPTTQNNLRGPNYGSPSLQDSRYIRERDLTPFFDRIEPRKLPVG